MHRTLSATLCLLSLCMPLAASALDVLPRQLYSDVPLGRKEAAAVTILQDAGIVQKANRFYPSRLVNRAEFLRMAMTWYVQTHSDPHGGYDWYRRGTVANDRCFSDVRLDDWFGAYVCEAYDAGFVGGFPDGLFHPERFVQYDEALKMLTRIFGYDVSPVADREWGEGYYRAAAARGVDLARTIRFDTPLSRGMAARLLAAFIAESEGALDALRLAEAGRTDLLPGTTSSSSSFSSSSASVASSSASSVVSSSSSSSSASSAASLFTLPPVSHFLQTGAKSDAIASIDVDATDADMYVSVAQVKLAREARSIKRLELVTEEGIVVASLLRRITTDIPEYALTFDAQIDGPQQIRLAKGKRHTLALRAVIRGTDDAGFSDDLVQVRSIVLTARAVQGDIVRSVSIPALGPFPVHQTSFGTIESLSRASTAATVSPGNVQAGSFALRTAGDPSRSFELRSLAVRVAVEDATVRGWSLALPGILLDPVDCTLDPGTSLLSCVIPSVPGARVSFGETMTVRLLASVTSVGKAPSIRVALPQAAGSIASGGSIVWSDGSGRFVWMEQSALSNDAVELR